MPDLGRDFVGSLQNSARLHRALPMSIWAGQNLNAITNQDTSHKGQYCLDCKSDNSEVTLREDSLV